MANLAKRKRDPVSYADDNDELDTLLFGEDHLLVDEEAAGDDEDVPTVDDEAEFGRKASKKAIAAKRQAKKARAASNKRHKKNEKPFPFLRLPQELRDMIYEYALTDDRPLRLSQRRRAQRRTVTRSVDTSSGAQDANSLAPALLAVNRMIHAEAAGILYGQSFVIDDTYTLHSFLATIGPNNCARVSAMTIKAWGGGRGAHKSMNFAAFVLLAACSNLKSLFIDCSVRWIHSPTHLARTIYREAYHFLEAYGTANGNRFAALDVIKLDKSNFSRNAYTWRHPAVQLDAKEFESQYREELRGYLSAAIPQG